MKRKLIIKNEELKELKRIAGRMDDAMKSGLLIKASFWITGPFSKNSSKLQAVKYIALFYELIDQIRTDINLLLALKETEVFFNKKKRST